MIVSTIAALSASLSISIPSIGLSAKNKLQKIKTHNRRDSQMVTHSSTTLLANRLQTNEDAAVVPTSAASETNGHAKRDDTLKQEDECNQDGNENPDGVPKQDATSKQDDTPKQGEPPRQETPKPIMMP